MTNITDDIRRLNDLARRQPSRANASWVITTGLLSLLTGDDGAPVLARLDALRGVLADFADWPRGNDPFGEHDFGAFTLFGEKLFFKIDYYTPDMEALSPDPGSIAHCRRILTIMLAREY